MAGQDLSALDQSPEVRYVQCAVCPTATTGAIEHSCHALYDLLRTMFVHPDGLRAQYNRR